MRIFLFSNHFPFGKSEPFIANEIPFAIEKNELIVNALYKTKNINHFGDFESNGFIDLDSSKFKLLIKGIFNLAPFNFHLAEIFQKGLFFKPKQLKHHLTSLLVCRTIMATEEWGSLIKRVKDSPDGLLYFYWGDNLVWTLPYLLKAVHGERRVVLRLHRTDLYEYLKSDHSPLRNIVFDKANLICPISQDGVDYLKIQYPQFSQKIKLSRLGVFDKGLNPSSKSKSIVCVSASYVTPVKQVHLIFKALQHVENEIEWHHFGDGPLMTSLKNQTVSKRKNLRVVLHGAVPNDQILQFYSTQSVSFFINASKSEGVPVSIMEALSFGIPVIAPSVGGIAELVNMSNGNLLPANFKCGELVAAIEAMVKLSEAELTLIRQAARSTFKKIANAKEIYPDFYNQLTKL
jgi:glycosyltransferase involved in cell wall biosynthesis